VVEETRHWRTTAQRAGIARADIELTAAAFAHSGQIHHPVTGIQ
jgi:hypothetical protein